MVIPSLHPAMFISLLKEKVVGQLDNWDKASEIRGRVNMLGVY